MIYFIYSAGDVAQRATATAETEATAQRLERAGFVRCTEAYWRAERRAREANDLARLFPADVPVYPKRIKE